MTTFIKCTFKPDPTVKNFASYNVGILGICILQNGDGEQVKLKDKPDVKPKGEGIAKTKPDVKQKKESDVKSNKEHKQDVKRNIELKQDVKKPDMNEVTYEEEKVALV